MWKIGRKLLKILMWGFAAVLLIALYARFVEPSLLMVRHFSISEDGQVQIADGIKSDNVVRIVQISDLHTGPQVGEAQLTKLVEVVNRQKPDVILFTGDLFDNYGKAHPTRAVIAALSDLRAPLGKYAVWGNRDYGGGAKRHYEHVLRQSGFSLLRNRGAVVTLPQDKTLFIGGLDDGLLGKPDGRGLMKSCDDQVNFSVVMVHEPDLADVLIGQKVDLIMAGHSHGGQVRLPFFYNGITAMAEKYIWGFYKLQAHGPWLYVNSGLGTSHLPMRLMAPPEVSIFDVTLPREKGLEMGIRKGYDELNKW